MDDSAADRIESAVRRVEKSDQKTLVKVSREIQPLKAIFIG